MKRHLVLCSIFVGLASAASAAELGKASYYYRSRHDGLIAAHRSLPFGTEVRVTNLDNGRSAVVKIVDRGPFVRGQIIDVSVTAAVALGFRQSGLAHVRIDKL